ncbi:hypothetical protein WR25_23560 [Diploscapter pachys]|uniref:FAD dependent oxidoreductase domain-containing protein n=1 Tax=Diploscapter pachys TaxID=2018661 RepID=A0A2A2KK24_9BILA|nr:hypothetical protein WR25_23560 [Diploscapter pachys]
MSGFTFLHGDEYDPNEPIPFWAPIMKHFTVLTPEEVKRRSPKAKAGYFFTTYYIQPTLYMDHLMKKFLDNGGKIEGRKVDSFDQIAGYDLIINCTGLNAHSVLKDKDLHPIRGQIIRYKCDGFMHFYNDGDTYILPNRDFLVIGGTKDRHKWETELDDNVAKKLLENAFKTAPQLRNGQILSHHVGLRPARSEIRIEAESLPSGQMVVHNYGHGGSGICLHWGCALEVANLVENIRHSSYNSSPRPVSSKI